MLVVLSQKENVEVMKVFLNEWASVQVNKLTQREHFLFFPNSLWNRKDEESNS